MRKKKYIYLIVLIFILSLALAGCGKKSIQVITTLELENGFSGCRQIVLEIDKSSFANLFSEKIEEFNKKVEENCPEELIWSPAENGDTYTYTFKLFFSSKEEYEQKVSKLTGEPVTVTLVQPESVFATGIQYKENFSSMELISWIGTLLESEGYVDIGSADTLFLENSATVIYEEQEYKSQETCIEIDSLIESPVERIDILTQYMQNKSCNRQVIFTFSQDALVKNEAAIKEYMKKNTPGFAEGVWSKSEESYLFTVSVNNVESGELNDLMEKIMGESDSFVSVLPRNDTRIFDSSEIWSETIDTSAFAYESNETVAVGYYVQCDKGMELIVKEQNSDQKIVLADSDRYGGYQTVLEKDFKQINLVTEVKATYTIEEIQVKLNVESEENISRKITLLFQMVPNTQDQEKILNKLVKQANGVADVSIEKEREDGKFAILVEQSGSIRDLNKGFEAIFGVKGQLAYEVSGSLMEIKHTARLIDQVDFTQFVQNDPLQTLLTYELTLPGGAKILEESVSSTSNTFYNGEEEIQGKTYKKSLSGAYLSLTLDGKLWNRDGFMLFSLLSFFAAIVSLTLFLINYIKKHHKNFGGFIKKLMAEKQSESKKTGKKSADKTTAMENLSEHIEKTKYGIKDRIKEYFQKNIEKNRKDSKAPEVPYQEIRFEDSLEDEFEDEIYDDFEEEHKTNAKNESDTEKKDILPFIKHVSHVKLDDDEF